MDVLVNGKTEELTCIDHQTGINLADEYYKNWTPDLHYDDETGLLVLS